MPTYVYACDSCGKQFEQFQSFKDEPLTVCRCGQEGKVRRVIQPAGVVFKGSGWYITDSRGGGSAAISSSDSGAKDGKSEKPETASASTPSDTSAPSAPSAPGADA